MGCETFTPTTSRPMLYRCRRYSTMCINCRVLRWAGLWLVSLSVCRSREPRQTSPNFTCYLPVPAVRSSTGGVAIFSILPVSWMTSYFFTYKWLCYGRGTARGTCQSKSCNYKTSHLKTLSCGIICVILRLAVLIQYGNVTDTRTDRRTDTRRRHILHLA